MQRFPVRTVVLMVLALLAFAWSWTQTHRGGRRAPPVAPGRAQPSAGNAGAIAADAGGEPWAR